MAAAVLWLSAGVGRGVGKEPRATAGGVVPVFSTFCIVGPDVVEETRIGSAVRKMPEILAKSGIVSLVTTSGELLRDGWLTKAGRGKDLGG